MGSESMVQAGSVLLFITEYIISCKKTLESKIIGTGNDLVLTCQASGEFTATDAVCVPRLASVLVTGFGNEKLHEQLQLRNSKPYRQGVTQNLTTICYGSFYTVWILPP